MQAALPQYVDCLVGGRSVVHPCAADKMAVSTASDLLAALEASNLLRPDQISALRQSHAAAEREVPAADAARALVKRGLLTRWQAEKLLGGHTAFFLGKYRLLERVGRGGMGSVYKARHEVMGRVVALKVMARSLVNDADAVARFKREVRAAAALSHPNIVTAYDADCAGDVHFLVMEYVDGRDLHWWIKQGGPLPIPWSCECIRQAAVGLEYARSRGLVHRDIKPSNLLVSQPDAQSPPIVKILDLGLARLVSEKQESSDLTRSGQIMGTPDYIAPEQAEDVHAADTRADIFSLGCTLFQMLTGQLPYGGATLMAKLLARTQRDAPPVQNLRPDVPAGLAAVVARMLARRPRDRYQTPGEVAEALAPFAQGEQAEGPGSSVLAAPENRPRAAGTSDVALACEEEAELNEFLHMLGRGDTHRESEGTVRAHPDAPGSKPPSGSRRKPRVRVEVIVSAAAALTLVVLGLVLWQLYGRSEQSAGRTAESHKPLVHANTGSQNTTAAQVGGAAQDPTTQGSETQPDGGNAESGDSSVAGSSTADDPANPTDDSTSGSQDDSRGSQDDSRDSQDDSSPPQTNEAPTSTTDSQSTAGTPSTSPAENAAEPGGRTLVVGVGADHYHYLDKALADARPGDIIRIRHRGPLFFDAADLAGKTPLTIEGDTRDGVDYWPLVVQAQHDAPQDALPRYEGLLQAQELDLTLRKLHLVVGGYSRPPVDAIVRMGSGTLRLEECTVQVLADPALRGDPALLARAGVVPLVAATGAGPCSVRLDRVFGRGFVLGGVLAAAGEGSGRLHVEGLQSCWASGGAPWVSVEQLGGPLHVLVERCTLYNLEGLVRYRGRMAGGSEPSVAIEARRNLFVGAYAVAAPFIDWQPAAGEPNWDQVLSEGQAICRLEGNVYHRFVAYYPAGGRRRAGTWTDWQRLVGAQSSGGVPDMELDPYLHVLPIGPALEECEPRDFEPRWERQRGDARRLKDIGVDAAAMPPALPALYSRLGVASAELAVVPRGRPTVLEVNRSRGPYKTLEAAFREARDEAIIEISDNGPYLPECNFEASGNIGVLESTASVLTVRARRGTRPVVVLHPGMQRGQLPSVENKRALHLFAVNGKTALVLDGLHIVVLGGGAEAAPVAKALGLGALGGLQNYGDSVRCAALCVQGLYSLRCTNCTILEAGTQPAELYVFANTLLGHRHRRTWFENCFVHCTSSTGEHVSLHGSDTETLTFTHCVVAGASAFYLSESSRGASVFLWGNTFLNAVGGISKPPVAIYASDNLVVTPAAPFSLTADVLRNSSATGSNNALWVGSGPLSPTDRAADMNALLPGPAMAQPPRFLSAASGTWGRYRLSRRQAYSTLAADGGPVGARLEYLPEMPAWMQSLAP